MIAFGIVVADWWLLLIGAFVMLGTQTERQQSTAVRMLAGVKVGHVMTWETTVVPAHVTAQELAPWLLWLQGRSVPVVDGAQYIGMLSADDLSEATSASTAAALCDRTVPTLDVEDDLLPAAAEAFQRTRRPAVVVLSSGRVAGVLYRAALEVVLQQGYGPSQAPP